MDRFILGFDGGYERDLAALSVAKVTEGKMEVISSETFNPTLADVAFDELEHRLLSKGVHIEKEILKNMSKELDSFSLVLNKHVE